MATTGQTANAPSVYVGNLGTAVTENDLMSVFESVGKIVEVRMIKGRDGASKGFAYVDFADGSAIQAACQKNGTTIKGQEIKVDVATAKRQTRSASEPNPPANTIFVGNLSYDAKEEDLKAAFAKCGTVKSVRVMADKFSGRPKGFAYVEFESVDEAKRALEMRAENILDRPITVDYAAPLGTRVVRPFRGGRGAPRGSFRGAPRGGMSAEGGRFRERPYVPRTHAEPVELSIPVDTKTVYVANLPYDVTPERIHQALTQCGTVLNIQLATSDGRPRGFAYVHFTTEAEAARAMAMNDAITMEGRRIRIEAARPPRAREPRAPRPEAAPSTRVHVGNMPRAMTAQAAEEELRAMFGRVGQVVEIETPTFPDGNFKGHAFVTFANTADAQKAVSVATGKIMGERELRPEFAFTEEQRRSMPPRRGFRGGRGRGSFRGHM